MSHLTPSPRAHGARIVCALLTTLLVCANPRADDAHVGAQACAGCHAAEAARWRGSHHDLAMAEASEETVLGDFGGAEFTAHGVTTRFSRADDGGYRVRTDGPDGALAEYAVTHTFGWYPVQQYLVPFPGGRMQPLGVAWDARPVEEGGQRWYHLYPDEPMDAEHPLHWAGREQTWNHQCAECHSTNLVKGYDPESDTYETTWSEMDVACEACHGPGSRHVAWAALAPEEREADAAKGLPVDLSNAGGWQWDAAAGIPARPAATPAPDAELQTCAQCHSRRGQFWPVHVAGRPLLDTHRLALLEDGLYFPDGQIRDEVYVYGSFVQSAMHQAGVTCSDCHDPHALTLRAQGNALCTRCHGAERYDTEAHHHHDAASTGAACVACHMPERTYMGIDARADHSLRVPRPDLSTRLGTPDACTGCHVDQDPRWAAQAVAEWGGERTGSGHFANAFAAAGAPGGDAALLAIATDASRAGIIRASAIARLAEPSAPAIARIRPALVSDPEPLVRMAAVASLEGVDLRTRVQQGWPALDDPVRAVRLAAARVLAPALAERLPPEAARRLSSALEEYLAAARVNADRPEAHLNLGVVATAARRGQAAEAAYRTALRLDPRFAPAYVNLADLYRQIGREPDALRTLREGVAAVPDSAALHHALGLALVRAGSLGQALAPLQRAARDAPGNARYALVLGLALRESGDGARAIAALERGLSRAPADPMLLQAIAATHAALGNLERAEEYARRLEATRSRADSAAGSTPRLPTRSE